MLDDRAVRLSAQATIDRKEFGVGGNLMGMVRDKATISGDVVFRPAPAGVRSAAWRHRPLRILVYSDNPRTREQVQLALGKRVHPELPELTYVEVATPPMVIRQMDEGGFDLVILDGEATPPAAWGSPNSSRTRSPTAHRSWC